MAFSIGGASGLASIQVKLDDKEAEKKLTEKKETNGLFTRLNKVTTGVFSKDNEEEKKIAGTDGSGADAAQKKAAASDSSETSEEKQTAEAKETAAKEAAKARQEALLELYKEEFGTDAAEAELSDSDIEAALEDVGVTDEEINARATEISNRTWLDKAAASVREGIDTTTTAIGDAIDYAEGLKDDAVTFLKDTQAEANALAAGLNSSIMNLPYVGEALKAFKCNFCARQPFPDCATCPHRQMLTNDRGFDLFRLISDIRAAIKQGIFDLANSLFDCPGMARAISNGDFGTVKSAVMNNALDALIKTGVDLGAATVFKGLADLSPNNEKWLNGIEFLDDLIQSHSAAIVKSIRTGDFDLVDGAYKLKNISVSDFYEISWGNEPYMKSTGYKKGVPHVEAWVGNTPSDASTTAIIAQINAANAKAAADAEAEAAKAAAAMAALEEKAATESATAMRNAQTNALNGIEAEKTSELTKGVTAAQLAAVGSVSKKTAKRPAISATSSLTTKGSIVSLRGIRTHGAQLPASVMAMFNGNRASLHSLKLAYGADARMFSSKIPSDVKYEKIVTRSDALFA